MQILEQTLSRLRFSTQGRILAELALVRICSLEDLDELPRLIAQLREASPASEPASGKPASAPSRANVSKPEPARAPLGPEPPAAPAAVAPSPSAIALTPENATDIWNQVLSQLSGLGARHAKDYADVATPAPNRLVIRFKPAYTLAKSICERPDQAAKFEEALAELTGQTVRVEFALLESDTGHERREPPPPVASPQQRLAEISQHPMIRRAGELFGANPVRVDDPPEKE
jgi:DNA polymerase-3 subunit gamma/tau